MSEAEFKIESMQRTPDYSQVMRHVKMAETTCKHEIFAEWCSICKYVGKSSAKQMLLERNLGLVENWLKWPKSLRK